MKKHDIKVNSNRSQFFPSICYITNIINLLKSSSIRKKLNTKIGYNSKNTR